MLQRYGFSERYYDSMRRRRAWSMNGPRGMQGYAAFLAGAEDGTLDVSPSSDVGSVVGAGTAAFESTTGASAAKAILIGVATGALTFLVNRWLGRIFK